MTEPQREFETFARVRANLDGQAVDVTHVRSDPFNQQLLAETPDGLFSEPNPSSLTSDFLEGPLLAADGGDMNRNDRNEYGSEIRMGLRPGAPDEGQAMWRTEGRENRARRRQWDKREHYLQAEQPFGPITFRMGDLGERRDGLVIVSGPQVPTVEFIQRTWMQRRAGVHGIKIDGESGVVTYPSGWRRARRRYDIVVGHRHWRVERHRFGRVVVRRVDLGVDRYVEVVGFGVAARLSALLRSSGLGVGDSLVTSEAEPADVAVLVALRFVGWSTLWFVRTPDHGGTRLAHAIYQRS